MSDRRRSGIKCFRPCPLDEVRAALGRRRSGSSCSRRRSRSASAGSSARTCAWRSSGLAARGPRRRRRPRRPADHPGARCTALLDDALAGPARAADASSTSTATLVERELARDARAARARARTPRTSCATSASSPPGRTEETDGRPADQVLPGRAPSRPATACSTPSSARCRPRTDRSNTLTSGHRACQGCGEALGARYALDAAMRATERPADRRQRDRLPRGLLDAVSRSRRGSCRGSTRCSATRRRSRPASPRR